VILTGLLKERSLLITWAVGEFCTIDGLTDPEAAN
jgi:hypothetical protein